MTVERCALMSREETHANLWMEKEKRTFWSHRRSAEYGCGDTEQEGTVLINWFQFEGRPEVCVVDYITTRPPWAWRKKYGTEALFRELGEMVDAGCKYLGGIVLNAEEARGFWGRLGVKPGRFGWDTFYNLETLEPANISLRGVE